MGADKNVLSLTVTRYTFVHKHIPTEKVVAWPNYIIHDYVCGVLSSERHILPDRENFFLNESLCAPESADSRRENIPLLLATYVRFTRFLPFNWLLLFASFIAKV